MPEDHLATAFPFTGLDSGDNAFMFVRAVDDAIVLGLSIETDGDLEVAMSRRDCEQLIEALQRAIETIPRCNGD